MIWFTADPHYGHEAILTYCNRPFRTLLQMDSQLIRNHNDLISPYDDVYILGDLSIRTKANAGYYEQLVRKLNGKLYLIMGNHDIKDPTFYVDRLGFKVATYPYLNVEEFCCVHDPALSQINRKQQFLCGHAHNLFVQQKNVLNVGVDVHNYKPISLPQIREYLSHNIIK